MYSIRNGMLFYESIHLLLPNLKILLEISMVIEHTSPENKRNYSTSLMFVSTLRTRLSTKTVDIFCLFFKLFKK